MKINSILPLAPRGLLLLSVIFLGGSGCSLLLGLDQYSEGQPAGSSGAGGATGATSTSAMTSGTMATGSSGSGGGPACSPASMTACAWSYDASKKDVGACRTGSMTCKLDGSGYDACAGQVAPAKEDCTVKGDEDCDGVPCSDALWAKVFGDLDTQRAKAVAIDSMGNIIVVGDLGGSADLGGGPILSAGSSDVFVAKLTADGTYLWAKRFGDGANQLANAVAVDASGNIVVGGSFQGTLDFGGTSLTNTNTTDTRAFLAKLDSAGVPIWSKAYGAASTQTSASGVGIDGGGNILVTGTFGGTIDLGSGSLPSTGGPDIFVAKLQPDGTGIWSHRFGGSDMGADYASSIAVDSSGGVAIAASASGTISFGGTVYPGAISVAKFDQAGAFIWSRGYAAVFPEVHGIAIDATGSVLLTGVSKSGAGIDFGSGALPKGGVFLAKFSAGGLPVWNKDFGGDSTAPNLAVDSNQNVALVGRFGGSITLGGAVLTSPAAMTNLDIFLASFDKSGNHLWSKALGEESTYYELGIAREALGNIVIAGNHHGSADFGTGPLVGMGAEDILVAKFAP